MMRCKERERKDSGWKERGEVSGGRDTERESGLWKCPEYEPCRCNTVLNTEVCTHAMMDTNYDERNGGMQLMMEARS